MQLFFSTMFWGVGQKLELAYGALELTITEVKGMTVQ
jgi:hypothetical protein